MVILIGLTGGIACGKSTVSTLLKERGLVQEVIDADLIVRDLQRPGCPVLKKIGQQWPDVIDPSTGELNRKALGAIIFKDPSARQRLGRIMNRPIFFAILKAIFWAWWKDLWGYLPSCGDMLPFSMKDKKDEKRKLSKNRTKSSTDSSSYHESIVILDAPTLYETKMFVPLVSNVLVVACSPALQKKRLLKRSNEGSTSSAISITEDEADQRIRSQMPLERKKLLAGYVIENEYDDDFAALASNVEDSAQWMSRQSSWRLHVLFGFPFVVAAIGLGGYGVFKLLF